MGHIHFLGFGELITWSFIVGGILLLFSIKALSKKSLGVPQGLQNVAEAIVEFLLGIFEPELGKDLMPMLLPFFGTFFVFIFVSNIFLLIPYTQSPTAELSTTLALAVISVVGAHILAIKIKGVKRYIKDWVDPYPELTQKQKEEETGEKVGFFKSFFKKVSAFLFSGMMRIIVGLLIMLHVVDNGARLLSLTFRLFGNIFGEHFVFNMVTNVAIKNVMMVIPLFIPFMILVLDILVALIQTTVFCMLSAFYLKEEAGIHTH